MDYFKPCKIHGKVAKYILEEMRWVCEDCEPEKLGFFTEILGVKFPWGNKEEDEY